MPNVMHHAHHPHHVQHHYSLYFMIGLTIIFALVLILSLVPAVNFPSSIIDPAFYRERAYLEYLQGEKVMYANPVELNNALAAYHAGEKVIYDTNKATWVYRLGEKSATLDLNALNAEDALYQHHMGEKNIE